MYDANGNLTGETDPLGYTIQFTYNLFAEPLTFVNQEGYTTSYQYDANGNLTETTNPDGTTQQYGYDSLGDVVSSTDSDGETIGYAYNTNGQLTTENLPDGTSNTYSYDPRGNMLTADGPGGDWSFTYNSENLPTAIVESYGTLTVKYGVDGNITQIADQTGFTMNYEYDAVGRLSEVTDGSDDLIESYSYDPAGDVISESKGNGTSTTYQYNADGEITQITNLAPGGSINSHIAYAYDSVGQITSMATGGVATAYGYDADGELTSASSPGDTILYAYDPAGNRTSVTDNGVVTNYTSNNVNEYTQVGDTTYQYDANGNMIAATTGGQTTSYTFNALDQLTGVSGPGGAYSYVYDPLGYQISSNVGGQTTNSLIDPFGLGNVLAQFDSAGTVTAQYTYGLVLVSQVTASGMAYFYDYNLQGSTVGITNSAGGYVNRYSYDPFGQVTTISAGIATPFTFVGDLGVSSSAATTFFMNARNYDPAVGQFISVDPVELDGQDTNFRRYAANDPIDRIDPSGLQGAAANSSASNAATGGEAVYVQGINTISICYTHDTSKTPPPNKMAPYSNSNQDNFPSHMDLQIKNPPTVQKDPGDNSTGGDCPEPPPPPPTPPPCIGCPGGGGGSDNQPPVDPNDLLGPSGYGSAGYLTPGGALPYTIEFSNEKTAEVPADNVVVTEQLSPNLNWSTFQLGAIGFGSYVVVVPTGLTSYSTRVDATATLGVYVDIDASLNLNTGLLTVTFTSLDPTTLDTPSNPLVVFLPPDRNPPNGEGYINYTIQPKAGLATGATINALASIVFDTNAAIPTPQITNAIDAGPPTSTVASLPATTTTPSFTVAWSGSDGAGPGIASYNVYVSDGGAYTLWQSDTTATSAIFTGKAGHEYEFYSVATDPLGLVQPEPATAQAMTTVVNPSPPPPPPAPVTVTSVHWETIKVKVGKGKKAKLKSEAALEIQFSGLVAGSGNLGAYQLASVTTKKVKKKTTTTYKPIRLTSALPASSPMASSVALVPASKPNLSQTDRLEIVAADLTDTLGRALDGNDDGQPGGNYVATFKRSGVTVDGSPLVRTAARSTAVRAAIDDLLARGELAQLTRSLRADRWDRPSNTAVN